MRKLRDMVSKQEPLVMPMRATVQEACARMRDRGVGSVLVVDEHDTLVGILTARDVVCRVVAFGSQPSEVPLQDVMTRDPVALSPSETAIDALRVMWDCDFHHVPLTRGGRIVGVVARSDFSGTEQDKFDSERALWEHMR